jgi:hypothetical protein
LTDKRNYVIQYLESEEYNMETKTFNVYRFGELNKNVQEKILDEFRYSNVDYNWWYCVYDDAKQIGLKINGFDLDYRTIRGEFIESYRDVIQNILSDHGEGTDTHQLAFKFNKLITDELEEGATINDNDNEKEFKDELLSLYLKMLKYEYEYLTSDEYLIDFIDINDFKFFKNGNMVKDQYEGVINDE